MEFSADNRNKILSPKPLRAVFMQPELYLSKTMFSSSSTSSSSLLKSTLTRIQETNSKKSDEYESTAATGGSITKRIKLFGAYIDVPIPQDFSRKEDEISEEIKPTKKRTQEYFYVPNTELSLRCEASVSRLNNLPMEFKNRICSLNEGFVVGDEVLVIEKMLSETDVKKEQNRFSIPSCQIKNGFLTVSEVAYLKTRNENQKKNFRKLHVHMIDPLMKQWPVKLGIWQMKNDFYAINGPSWSKIVASNDLKQGDLMQLWAVRVGDSLWFALVRLAKAYIQVPPA